MRLITAILMTALLTGHSNIAVSHAQTDTEVERAVARHVQALLPPDNAGGVAVAVRMKARTLFLNNGIADVARRQPVTSDSIFNLASVGKLFATTLLAQAIENGELRLDEPVASYHRAATRARHPASNLWPACEPHVGPASRPAELRTLAQRKIHAPRLHSLPQGLEGGCEP
jgi:CubicO group peptidase (beta-lactamase class C family)